MKAFISYSHIDKAMLDKLEIHLANLKREHLLSSWTDKELIAGTSLDKEILHNLTSSDLFIALISPEYIASYYCYEKEFNQALEMFKGGKITIVPIIVEPCEWDKTPFRDFKALPADGKPISDWQNINTAFLNITQELRKLSSGKMSIIENPKLVSSNVIQTRNYKVKKDFDSIQRLEFKEKSFLEIKKLISNYLSEVEQLDNIFKRITSDSLTNFEVLLVNRNKINAEAKLIISIDINQSKSNNFFANDEDLRYSFNDDLNQYKSFKINQDEFELHWENIHSNSFMREAIFKHNARSIADEIWEDLLKKVGIE